jgi:uncharacterized protein YuzE
MFLLCGAMHGFTFDPDVNMASLRFGVRGHGQILTSFCDVRGGQLGIDIDELGHVVGFEFQAAAQMLPPELLDDPAHVRTRLSPDEIEAERRKRHGGDGQ